MNQKIFTMGLSTEAVSLYLLCCSLANDGRGLSWETIAPIWNNTPAKLTAGLKELGSFNILVSQKKAGSADTTYSLTPEKDWSPND